VQTDPVADLITRISNASKARKATTSVPHSKLRESIAHILKKAGYLKGRGLVAGSAVRNVLVLAGITDTVAKLRSPSKNKLNIARAAVLALQGLSKGARPGAKAAVVPPSK
jgi:ribosomal protein S8